MSVCIGWAGGVRPGRAYCSGCSILAERRRGCRRPVGSNKHSTGRKRKLLLKSLDHVIQGQGSRWGEIYTELLARDQGDYRVHPERCIAQTSAIGPIPQVTCRSTDDRSRWTTAVYQAKCDYRFVVERGRSVNSAMFRFPVRSGRFARALDLPQTVHTWARAQAEAQSLRSPSLRLALEMA